jgi:hypothetical protein
MTFARLVNIHYNFDALTFIDHSRFIDHCLFDGGFSFSIGLMNVLNNFHVGQVSTW